MVAISAYWSTSREAFERLWLSLVPAPQRPRARDVWRGVERAVGSHVRGELAVSVLSALLLAVVFRLAYLPLPMLPALAAGVLRLIPFFGVPAAAGAAFLAGSTVSIAVGAASAAVTVVVILAVDQIVARRLLAARRPSQTLTVLMVVALVDAYGLIGLVFASTLAMAIEACLERLIVTHPQQRRPEQTVAHAAGTDRGRAPPAAAAARAERRPARRPGGAPGRARRRGRSRHRSAEPVARVSAERATCRSNTACR